MDRGLFGEVGGFGSRRQERPKKKPHNAPKTVPWSTKFPDPIPLPGRKLVTLLDAGNYIASLPESEQAKPHWQTAAELLMLVATEGGDPMLARIGMMQALNHGVERAERKKRARRFNIIRSQK